MNTEKDSSPKSNDSTSTGQGINERNPGVIENSAIHNAVAPAALEGVNIEEATDQIVLIDKNQFMDLIRYCADNNLLDDFSSYLDEQQCSNLHIDKEFANYLKKFLLRGRHVTDPLTRNAIACSCIRSAHAPERPA